MARVEAAATALGVRRPLQEKGRATYFLAMNAYMALWVDSVSVQKTAHLPPSLKFSFRATTTVR